MDFESPDVEKDFPGLYASESVKKCNESDFSDDNHDKSFKKDLIGKRKEKKDSKKDRGYAALEGESSPDEDTDSKSPSKSKKSKSFKFPTKKSEKREKSREKDGKEKEKDADKDKDRKKDKDKKEKDKVKQKDKKKKHGEEPTETSDDFPLFGVPLAVAVERSGCLDGMSIPLVVRQCIDCIHSYGLSLESLYKVTGVKSKVQTLRKSYNLREPVSFGECDVATATCLLKMYLKELTEPILTNELLARFEEAGAIREVAAREAELQNLLKALPHCNRALMAWLIVHFDTVTMHEKQNKINAQSIAMSFSPVLQMSHRLLTALLCHCKALFPNIAIERYVPPLCAGSSFPEAPREMAAELKKQELLLNQIHRDMSEGFVSKKKEEQLWEVQRIVTQLKRKLKTLQRSQEASLTQRSLDEENPIEEANLESAKKIVTEVRDNRSSVATSEIEIKKEPTEEKVADGKSTKNSRVSPMKPVTEGALKESAVEQVTEPQQAERQQSEKSSAKSSGRSSPDRSKPRSTKITTQVDVEVTPKEIPPKEKEWDLEELKLQLEHEHLLKLQATLQDRIDKERLFVEKLRLDINSHRGYSDSLSDDSSAGSTPACLSPESEARMEQLIDENHVLEEKKDNLVRRILEEREACLKLRVYIGLLEMTARRTQA